MTYPRSMSVSLEGTPRYHVVARCVRRAWLWGVDEYAGKDYSHRKQWILDRLTALCMVFTIDCLATLTEWRRGQSRAPGHILPRDHGLT